MFKFINSLLPKSVRNNRGVFKFGVGGAVESGYKSGKSSSKTETGATEFSQAPEFEEAEGARKAWWQKLQQFGGDPGYGAISPDWGSIWESAQRKVQQYFWGSATDPGVVERIKGSAAGRGVGESPTREKMMQRMAAQEGTMLQDMAVEQSTKEAEFGEAGRLNYMQGLQTLAGYKPEVAGYTPWQKTKEKSSEWDIRGKVEGGVGWS